MAEEVYGYATAGLFGSSQMTGGYAGGQAQYARVPFADVVPLKIPDGSRTNRSCSCPTSFQSFVITHRLPLDDAPKAYRMFRDEQDECIKVVLKPHGGMVH